MGGKHLHTAYAKRPMLKKAAPPEVLSTPVGFAEGVLGYPRLYQWQVDVMQPFMFASGDKAKMVQVAVMSPNEGGRSSLLVIGIATWWLAMHYKRKSRHNDGGSETVQRTDSARHWNRISRRCGAGTQFSLPTTGSLLPLVVV